MPTRTLFSVIEVTPASGEPYCYVNWHHDLEGLMEVVNPNGEMTDKLIDIAEEILDASPDDDEEDALELSNGECHGDV